ncbi:MAG TPA: hypothetical protein DCS66_19880 [Flavobacteriaceae bacterium]|nr:hypothetical protein [Flavobacteriaceae bacterium]HAT66817.1 hypothetical protein [Flavobacteriaceae bacterium]|tara:strand:- start:120062 stop:121450 length:1389 start_codon:yes stop_codon:yes gene_type:complete
MKKAIILNWMLLALFALSFSSCTNETLEGEFITDNTGTGNGEFSATIDGENFVATAVTAELTDGVLNLKATDAGGNVVTLLIENVGICTYDLSLQSSSAEYAIVNDNDSFSTLASVGGSGSARIIALESEALKIAGTFQFNAIRQVNGANEFVVVTNGVFTGVVFDLVSGSALPNECETSGGGNVDPETSFFAKVDLLEFVEETIEVTRVTVYDTPMVNIVATTANGAQIRIDIPENIGGVGTYTFPPADMPISNGAILFASYNDAAGGESLTAIPETGTITFTEFGANTGKMTATFSFMGQDPIDAGEIVEITQGEFTIDFIENSGGIEDTFTADIDGEEYTYDSIEVTQNPFNGQTIINITTIDSVTNRSLTISFPIDIEVGNYEMSPFFTNGDEVVGIHNPNIGSSILFKSNPGTLSIFSYEYSSGVLEGAFSFSAVDPLANDPTIYEVTNGYFVITLQ